MALLDWIRPRRRAPRDLAGLASFVESRAAFLVQKTIYEYSRARASVHSDTLFGEEAFVQAVNRACWTGLPDGLVFEALMVDARLRKAVPDGRLDMIDGLVSVIDEVAARQPTPDVLEPGFWTETRPLIAERIRRGAAVPAKPVNEIPLADLDGFFARMPIHERLRGHDYDAVGNSLRAHLVNHAAEFDDGLDAPAMAALLVERGRAAPDRA